MRSILMPVRSRQIGPTRSVGALAIALAVWLLPIR
jgi:hypothetical protein